MNDIQFREFEREDNLRQERLDAIADKRTGDWLTHQYHASPSPNCHLCAGGLSLVSSHSIGPA